jgi:Protein of unknown function (DUF3238)
VKQGASWNADGSVAVKFKGAAANPVGLPGTPAIDFAINATCTGGNCTPSGSHDGFPAYRLEVTNEQGATNTIYEYDPYKAGDSPIALFPPMERCAGGPCGDREPWDALYQSLP